MLLSEEELEAMHEGGLPNSYMDPVLANNEKEYAKFISRLAKCGVVGFSESIRCQCGIFFVRKKNGSLRLILDARLANTYFRRAPSGRNASAACFGELRGKKDEQLFVSQYDVKDFFYRL
eukprot:5319460-Karenia_brevis.AAC.1